MAGAFFTGWALWQKMVFILACCLLVTIFAGLIKLWYTHYRKRRYAALEKLADTVQVIREKSIIRSLSTKKVKTPRRKSARHSEPPPMPAMAEIPFGIRALEEGTHVDDVWDSRPNSREHSRVDIYRQSATSTSNLVQAARAKLGSRDMSDLTAGTESSGTTIITEPSVQDLTPGEKDAYARSRYPPHSFARYEGTRSHRTTNSFSRRRQEVPRPDGVQTSHSASTFLSTTSGGGSDSEGGVPEYQMRLNSRSRRSQPSSMRSSSAESVTAMQQRRLSQCAETGQILPRLRTDLSGSEGGADVHHAGTPRHQRRMSFDMSDSGEDSDAKHFSTPSLKGAASTADSNESPSTAERIGRKMKRLRKRSTPASSPPATPATPSSTFSMSGHPDSDVLRQVNPGFAVLKPGSLESSPVRAPTESGTETRSSSMESSTRKGRRLQKKRLSQDSTKE